MIPKPVLVTTGASFVVPALLFALLAVGVVFVAHRLVPWRRLLATRGQARVAAAARHDADAAQLRAQPLRAFAVRAREISDRSGEARSTPQTEPTAGR